MNKSCIIDILHTSRVARWYIFKPKIPIRVSFAGSCNRKCWYILWPFGPFSSHFVYFMALWYIFHVLVYCTTEYLATVHTSKNHTCISEHLLTKHMYMYVHITRENQICIMCTKQLHLRRRLRAVF
jgi:hypothetical protein